MDQVKIGRFIAACRQAKGLTQQEFADKIGVTNKAVSKWECGKGLPDVSVYESICTELGVTLNEFFAGEHIEADRIAAQSDKNLETILTDYYTMKKQRKTVLSVLAAVLAVILAAFLIYCLNTALTFGFVAGLDAYGTQKDVIRDVSAYSKTYYTETYGSDLDSSLSVFPDAITDDMQVLYYESALSAGLFDTAGYILLEYALNDAAFESEVSRLRSLEIEIENGAGEAYTNTVMYVEGMYSYPAYITIDGFDGAYEYALIDETGNRIICVYLSGLQGADLPYEEYLKKDLSSYDLPDGSKAYTMYNHSFDGGRSYVEFDD